MNSTCCATLTRTMAAKYVLGPVRRDQVEGAWPAETVALLAQQLEGCLPFKKPRAWPLGCGPGPPGARTALVGPQRHGPCSPRPSGCGAPGGPRDAKAAKTLPAGRQGLGKGQAGPSLLSTHGFVRTSPSNGTALRYYATEETHTARPHTSFGCPATRYRPRPRSAAAAERPQWRNARA
jgi:hypothetical protein